MTAGGVCGGVTSYPQERDPLSFDSAGAPHCAERTPSVKGYVQTCVRDWVPTYVTGCPHTYILTRSPTHIPTHTAGSPPLGAVLKNCWGGMTGLLFRRAYTFVREQ